MYNQFKTQKFKHLMLAMGPRDLNSAPYSPVHCSSHSMTSFQSSELTKLPGVENSQLFAQRAHSARYAPKGLNKEFISKGSHVYRTHPAIKQLQSANKRKTLHLSAHNCLQSAIFGTCMPPPTNAQHAAVLDRSGGIPKLAAPTGI